MPSPAEGSSVLAEFAQEDGLVHGDGEGLKCRREGSPAATIVSLGSCGIIKRFTKTMHTPLSLAVSRIDVEALFILENDNGYVGRNVFQHL